MYRSIYIPVDNSAHALRGIDLGVQLARACGAALTGSHVYAAKLHDRRFRQMESGLPDRYLAEEKLVEQREIHDDLITKGLRVISDSYLDVFESRCRAAGLACNRVALEGKNWEQLVEDIGASAHDLVIMGALGLGAVSSSVIGSVCERVARRIDRDLLIVKDVSEAREESTTGSIRGAPTGAIAVAIDGSAQSFGALKTALELGRLLGRPVEAIAAFDPHFHYVAFDRLSRVLSAEAATVFRFKEQEKLHEEIIDGGLEKVYRANLDLAQRIAEQEGATGDSPPLTTRLLAGKPFEQILRYVRETRPWLLALGRIGIHSPAGMDLGSTTENLLRLADCNLLISARTFEPPADEVAKTHVAWTSEAKARMDRVPAFARKMATQAVVRHAVERGHTMITSDVIDACLASVMPAHGVAASTGKCPFAHGKEQGGGAHPRPAVAPAAFDGVAIDWQPAALQALEDIDDPVVRGHEKLRIEKMARLAGADMVTAELVAKARGTRPQRVAPAASVAPGALACVVCGNCGYTVRAAAPLRVVASSDVSHSAVTTRAPTAATSSNVASTDCPICGAPESRFVPVADPRHVTAASQGALFWHEEARAKLEAVPAGPAREMTRWRVEAWARRHDRVDVTPEIVDAKFAGWENSGATFVPTLPWDDDARAKMERMPGAIRAVVMRAIERHAAGHGEPRVTRDTLHAALTALQSGAPFHG
jgi:nucleotide-binding universal stress UspA family protein